jgi:hypothetical protein
LKWTVVAILDAFEATVYGGKPAFMIFFTVPGNRESLDYLAVKFVIMPSRKWIEIHLHLHFLVARKRSILFAKLLGDRRKGNLPSFLELNRRKRIDQVYPF